MRPTGGTRLAIQVACLVLPWALRRRAYQALFGWEIHPTARIGASLVDVDMVRMGPDASIGPFNVFHRLRLVDLAEEVVIGRYNWFRVADAVLEHPDTRASLVAGRQVVITQFHFIDVSGGLDLGRLAVIGGVRSTILGHQPDTRRVRQQPVANSLADRAMLASAVAMAPGTHLAENVVVAMGSSIRGKLDEESRIYAGNPARPVADVPEAFVTRETNEG